MHQSASNNNDNNIELLLQEILVQKIWHNKNKKKDPKKVIWNKNINFFPVEQLDWKKTRPV